MKRETSELVSKIAVDLANENQGFVRVAPYGDAPQYDKLGNEITQRFDYESAKALVKNFRDNASRLLARLGFKSAGVPFYNGHPDFGNVDDERDSRVYAEAEALEARKDGLYAKIKKFPALELLKQAKGLLQISPRWLCKRDEDGTMKPFQLISFGLVKTGNLVGADFINEKQGEQKKMNDKQMQELGSLLGIDKENITAEAIISAVGDLVSRDKGADKTADTANVAVEAEKKDDMDKKEKVSDVAETDKETDAEMDDKEEEKTTDDAKNACGKGKKKADDAKNACEKAIKEKEEKEKELDAVNCKLKEANTALAGMILDKAEAELRISPAMRSELEKEFAEDFVNTKAKVEALPVLEDFKNSIGKTLEEAAKTAKAQDEQQSQIAQARKDFCDLVNKHKMENLTMSYADCVSHVALSNKELYDKCKY